MPGGTPARGTAEVGGIVHATAGAIGYADASQARELGNAKIKVGDSYVGPSTEAGIACARYPNFAKAVPSSASSVSIR